jgi:hypothetical protein
VTVRILPVKLSFKEDFKYWHNFTRFQTSGFAFESWRNVFKRQVLLSSLGETRPSSFGQIKNCGKTSLLALAQLVWPRPSWFGHGQARRQKKQQQINDNTCTFLQW